MTHAGQLRRIVTAVEGVDRAVVIERGAGPAGAVRQAVAQRQADVPGLLPKVHRRVRRPAGHGNLPHAARRVVRPIVHVQIEVLVEVRAPTLLRTGGVCRIGRVIGDVPFAGLHAAVAVGVGPGAHQAARLAAERRPIVAVGQFLHAAAVDRRHAADAILLKLQDAAAAAAPPRAAGVAADSRPPFRWRASPFPPACPRLCRRRSNNGPRSSGRCRSRPRSGSGRRAYRRRRARAALRRCRTCRCSNMGRGTRAGVCRRRTSG